jgi:uncharacterized protein YegL
MNTKHQVHNLIILDESGSMEEIKNYIIQGFNELVQNIKGIEKQYPEQAHFITLITFNGLGQKILHFIDPVEKIEQINDSRYKPDSLTPLYDAMGFSIAKLRQVLENVKDYNVLVTVMTDGEENNSKEFTGSAIKKLVEDLKLNRWTFTYIGANHDVEKFAKSLSISNSMHFCIDEDGIKKAFMNESRARTAYSLKIRMNEDTNTDFYKDDDSK